MTAGLATGGRSEGGAFSSRVTGPQKPAHPGAIFVGHKGASDVHSADVVLNDI